MKKRLTHLGFASLLLLMGASCEKSNSSRDNQPTPPNCFKGRLELKGICANYTIQVLEGAIDDALIEKSWTNPATGQVHKNVFGIANYCSFPKELKQGDEFYFTVIEKNDKDCARCEAYYPTPTKKLSIQVSTTPCDIASN